MYLEKFPLKLKADFCASQYVLSQLKLSVRVWWGVYRDRDFGSQLCGMSNKSITSLMEKVKGSQAERGLGSHFTQGRQIRQEGQGWSLDSEYLFAQASLGLHYLKSRSSRVRTCCEQAFVMGAIPALAALGLDIRGRGREAGAPLTWIFPGFAWALEERRPCHGMGALAECTQCPHQEERCLLAQSIHLFQGSSFTLLLW